MYAQNPQNVLTYFDYLQAVNVKKWAGWTPFYNAHGPVFYDSLPRSYINIRPRTAAEMAGGSGGGGSSTTAIIAVVAALAVIGGILVWWLRSRGGRAEEA